MTPAVVSPQTVRRPHVPNRKLDRAFFAGMILLLWATVLWGFARTYFLAGMVAAPLPNRLIHFHGAVFTAWMVLLLVQSALIVSGNVRLHRRLGMAGFVLAVAMIGLGLFAAVDQLRRNHAPPGVDAQTFFVVPLTGMAIFAVLVYLAYRERMKPELHKRLILIATIEIIGAAIGRLPIEALQVHPPLQDAVTLGFLLMIVAFDVVSLHRLSKATVRPAVLLIVIHAVRIPLGMTPAFHSFAQLFLKA